MDSRAKMVVLGFLTSLSGLSCGGDAPTNPGTPHGGAVSNAEVRPPTAGRSAAQTGGPVKSGNAAIQPTSNIPRGAQYTIFCETFGGPTHIPMAKTAKDKLVRDTGMPDFHVIINEGRSDLCYGYYREVLPERDPKEAARAESDKRRLLAINVNGGPRFRGVTTIALSLPDPEAPPEWNVINSKGYWSVVIAGYTDPKTRKADAVDSVRAAREMGVDAYYFHGENVSNVCIGSFPKEAVKAQEESSARSYSESQDLVVLTAQPSPEEERRIKAANGDRKVIAPRIEIADKALLDTMKAYPEYSLDGNVDMNTGKDKAGNRVTRPKRSFLIEIPVVQKTMLSGSNAPASVEPTPALINPTHRNTGGGTLRGLNETGPR